MNINDLTIGQAKEIAKLVSCSSEVKGPKNHVIEDGRKVIVRSRDAGVLYGTFVSLDGTNVQLKDAIQVWKWKAVKGGTLIDCAEHGIVKSDSKVSSKSSSTLVLGACAIISVSKEAEQTFEGAGW